MLTTPMDVLHQFPVRKSRAQKQAFRDAVQAYAESLGYSVAIEKGSMGVRNLVIGDPKTAKYLVTAHYDTCARMFFPNVVTPCNALVYWSYQILLVLVLFVETFVLTLAVWPDCGNHGDRIFCCGCGLLVFPVADDGRTGE